MWQSWCPPGDVEGMIGLVSDIAAFRSDIERPPARAQAEAGQPGEAHPEPQFGHVCA